MKCKLGWLQPRGSPGALVTVRERFFHLCPADTISGGFSALQAVSATALASTAVLLAHFAMKMTNRGGWGYAYLSFSSSIEKYSYTSGSCFNPGGPACRWVVLGKATGTSPSPRPLALISPLGKLCFSKCRTWEIRMPCSDSLGTGWVLAQKGSFPEF